MQPLALSACNASCSGRGGCFGWRDARFPPVCVCPTRWEGLSCDRAKLNPYATMSPKQLLALGAKLEDEESMSKRWIAKHGVACATAVAPSCGDCGDKQTGAEAVDPCGGDCVRRDGVCLLAERNVDRTAARSGGRAAAKPRHKKRRVLRDAGRADAVTSERRLLERVAAARSAQELLSGGRVPQLPQFASSPLVQRERGRYEEECLCTARIEARRAALHADLSRVLVVDMRFPWNGVGNSLTRWLAVLQLGLAAGRATFLWMSDGGFEPWRPGSNSSAESGEVRRGSALRAARVGGSRARRAGPRRFDLGEFFSAVGADYRWGRAPLRRLRRALAARNESQTPYLARYSCARHTWACVAPRRPRERTSPRRASLAHPSLPFRAGSSTALPTAPPPPSRAGGRLLRRASAGRPSTWAARSRRLDAGPGSSLPPPFSPPLEVPPL